MTVKIDSRGERAVARMMERTPGTNGAFEILVRANGVELTNRLREAVSRKIGRVRQYAPRAFRARVNLEREHMKAADGQFSVTVRYEIPGSDIIAEHRAHEPMAALDLVSEKIERRLRKRKTARLASRVGRRGKPCRIADFCGGDEFYPPGRR